MELHRIVQVANNRFAVEKSCFGHVWSQVYVASSIGECEQWCIAKCVTTWQIA